jgi:hypothetical protein
MRSTIISDPAPTDVNPTASPPTAPMADVTAGRTDTASMTSKRSLDERRSNTRRTTMAAAPRSRATPSVRWTVAEAEAVLETRCSR